MPGRSASSPKPFSAVGLCLRRVSLVMAFAAGCLVIAGLSPAGAGSDLTSPINGLIAGGGGNTLGVVAPDGSGYYTALGNPDGPIVGQDWDDPAWSPDGSTLAVESPDGSIRFSDRLGNLDAVTVEGADPAWTPSGDLVVVRRSSSWQTALWLVDRSGQDISRLIDSGGASVRMSKPAVSPDGLTVAYERRVPFGQTEIYAVPIAGGAEEPLITGQPYGAWSVDWSPDGSRILYVVDYAVWTSNADGGDRVQVVSSPTLFDATWSPDGDSIAYASSRFEDGLSVFEIASGVSTRLPLTPGGDIDWQPLPACSVQGTEGADVLAGTPGDDVICAGAGDDVIEETPGDDIVLGGAGRDISAYGSVPPGVDVNLERLLSRGAGADLLMSTEGAIGTAAADTLIGDRDAETMVGGDGDDTLAGGMGADVLDAGSGSDTLGSNYERSQSGGYDVDLAAGTAREQGVEWDQVVIDRLSGFENVIGTRDPDVIRGDANDNRLDGGEQTSHNGDTFEGRGGNDTIVGPNSLGDSTAVYTSAPSAVSVDLVQGTVTGGDGDDTLTGIRAVDGSSYDDQFHIGPGANVAGHAGNDRALFTGLAAFHGGSGDDRVDARATPHGVQIDNGMQTWARMVSYDVPWYPLTEVERFELTPFRDAFHGGVHADTVAAGAGNDLLSLGSRATSPAGSADQDRLLGGSGHDTLTAARSSTRLAVDLKDGWAQAPGIDQVRNIEVVRGSPYSDRILGRDRADRLIGNSGADTLRGRSGADILNGNDGADLVHGGPGPDRCRTDDRDTVVSCLP